DLEYLSAIRDRFVNAGKDAKGAATACTVRLVEDLLQRGLCKLATWSELRDAEYERMELDHPALTALVDALPRTGPFAHFLTCTEAGDEWVQRYSALEREL